MNEVDKWGLRIIAALIAGAFILGFIRGFS